MMVEIPQSDIQCDSGIALLCTLKDIEHIETLGYAGEMAGRSDY